MKLLIVGLATLGSISVFAHPSDQEPLANIGIGSEISVLSNINIPPNAKSVKLGVNCQLTILKIENFDRVLSAGTQLVIRETGSNADRTWLYLNDYDSFRFHCRSHQHDPDFRHRETIGEFKNEGEGIFTVRLASPKPL